MMRKKNDPLKDSMMRTWLLLPFLLLSSAAAHAADACPQLWQQTYASDVATRIAAVACREHMLWYRPFIDRNGRQASAPMMEAESSLLSVGDDRAWQRVARYWRDSGLLAAIGHRRGATECLYASATGPQAEACRGFVVDTPWSAAFISWVMREARVPGFRGSSRHFTYVQAAYQQPSSNAFDIIDVAKAKPVVGDLICYVRQYSRLFGYEGLVPLLRSGSSLDMHCDIVVAVNPGNDSTAYAIGGNVQQSVTMRMLPLNRNGEFWGGLPLRIGDGTLCAPDNEAACNMNRQDWAAILRLKSSRELAKLQGALPPEQEAPEGGTPEKQECCINCVVGAGVPRCPADAVDAAEPSATP